MRGKEKKKREERRTPPPNAHGHHQVAKRSTTRLEFLKDSPRVSGTREGAGLALCVCEARRSYKTGSPAVS